LKPDRSPAGIEFKDVDGSPTHKLMLADKDAELSKLAYGQRPAEELYDKTEDPFCLNNLASNPEYRQIMDSFWKVMQEDLKKGGDPRMLGYGDIWESYPRYSKTRDYPGFNTSKKYNPEYVDKAIRLMNEVGITNTAYEVRAKSRL
jgi:uncharacterized sulfatase